MDGVSHELTLGPSTLIVEETMAADFISVRIGKVPGQIREVLLNGERTVGAALSAASGDLGDTRGYEMKVNGQTVNASTSLTGGETIVLVKQIKGN